MWQYFGLLAILSGGEESILLPPCKSKRSRVSNKQIASAVRTALAISKDVAGNLSAGQDARVVAHLENLMSVLEGINTKLEAGNDFRAEQKLTAVLKTAYDKLDEMPAFDPTLIDASFAKWSALGVDFSKILTPAAEALDPNKATTPEMKALFEDLKRQMEKQTGAAA